MTILLGGHLAGLIGGHRRVELAAAHATLAQALAELWRRHPALRDRVLDEQGRVRQHVNIFVESEECRRLGGLQTPLQPAAHISILPAVSGGCGQTGD